MGAGFTVFGVLANIANQNETARISRERKLLSARALLPIALQDVSDVAEAAARYSAAGRDHPIRPPPDLRLPERSLSVIRDLIELTDDIRVSQRLIGLLTEHQIYVEDWRRNLMGAGEGRPPEISAITAQWVFLRAVAQSIMPYARYEADSAHAEICPDAYEMFRQRFEYSGRGDYQQAEGDLAASFRRKYGQ